MLRLGGRKIQLESVNDLLRKLMLQRRKLVILYVDGVAPQDLISSRVDQLGCDSQVFAISHEGSGEQRVDFQVASHHSWIDCFVAISVDRRRRTQRERAYITELRNNRIGQGKAEEVRCRIRLQITKRKHCQASRTAPVLARYRSLSQPVAGRKRE